jgi:hypothetical protein
MYCQVKFGVGQRRVFVIDVRSQQLLSHIHDVCVREYRRALTTKAAQVSADQAAGRSRLERISDFLAQPPPESDGSEEAVAQRAETVKKLEAETQELKKAQEGYSTVQEKIREAQALLDEGGRYDLVRNGTLAYLPEGGDRYADQPVDKGALSSPLEPGKL